MVAVLVVAGTALAVVQVRMPAALWATAYGCALLAKIAFVFALLVLPD
jgi:putative copper export protein